MQTSHGIGESVPAARECNALPVNGQTDTRDGDVVGRSYQDRYRASLNDDRIRQFHRYLWCARVGSDDQRIGLFDEQPAIVRGPNDDCF